MPLGMPAYDCDPNTGFCGGGFGGGHPSGFYGERAPSVYSWGVVNVPQLTPYVGAGEREVIDERVAVPVVPSTAPETIQTMQTTQTPANQQPPPNQAADGSRQAAGNSLIVPVLIVVAALAVSR